MKGLERLEPLPTEEAVRSQGFDYKPEWWRQRLPVDCWPAHLGHTRPDRPSYLHVTRSDVFELAVDRSREGLVRLLVAAFVWGTGDSGFLVGRRARVFTKNDLTELGERLHDATRVLEVHGSVAAFESLLMGGPNKIKYLGPSFFTKFLYFSSPELQQVHTRPLILDQFVAVGLNDVHGWSLREEGPWTGADYGRYLTWATNQAGLRGKAHRIEKALFDLGKKLKRDRRSKHDASPRVWSFNR